MYESMTFEFLLERALNRVPNTVDKREGSIVYDAIAPCCAELASVYIELDRVRKETFAGTASTIENLAMRTEERGILPYEATQAILQMETTPLNIEVAIGERFSLEKMNYIVTEKIANGKYKVQCETTGIDGNKHFGQCIPINYIDGLETCIITELLIPAEDIEEIEHLRKRYFDSFSNQAFGGNRADYEQKLKSLDGVGAVRLYRNINGGGIVNVNFLNSEFGVPSEDLVTFVQNAVDPVAGHGQGLGFAPFGHTVTVRGAYGTEININMTLTYSTGWGWEDVETHVYDAIDTYFLELAKQWETVDDLVVRISQLETRILSIDGIVDITGTTLNGSAENLTVYSWNNTIPVRGVVNAS